MPEGLNNHYLIPGEFHCNYLYWFILGAVDNRCYLENGGSAESFFVSEDMPIGSVIGKSTTQIPIQSTIAT